MADYLKEWHLGRERGRPKTFTWGWPDGSGQQIEEQRAIIFIKLLSQINLAPRTSNVHPPVLLVDRILLIQVDLEELVVSSALEVFVPDRASSDSQDPIRWDVWSDGVTTHEFNFWKFA